MHIVASIAVGTSNIFWEKIDEAFILRQIKKGVKEEYSIRKHFDHSGYCDPEKHVTKL